MELEFSSNRLANASVSLSEASRLFGVPIGRKYIQRLAILRATDNFSQLYGLRALRLHPLKGERAGQYAITLTGNYRLIIEKVQEDKIRIMDVEDYHGN
ncbi:MAG: type II toxin-antitoxin system RelE/ParE family toxin [Chloroflexi bacterium]|nr:type II toxin-antitoxin system RelE/ParE family toxin [Chloroflexota bacterium]